jgi:hypothetical protein
MSQSSFASGKGDILKPFIKNNADDLARIGAQKTLRENNERIARQRINEMAEANKARRMQTSLPSIKRELKVRKSNPILVEPETKRLLAKNGYSYPSARTAQIIAANKSAPGRINTAQTHNAKSALQTKLKRVQRAQDEAYSTKKLADGRIRYQEGIEKSASTPGPTRGSAMVTEYNPNNGGVKSWYESRTHTGSVNRVNPKFANGETVKSEHIPPTGKDLAKR